MLIHPMCAPKLWGAGKRRCSLNNSVSPVAWTFIMLLFSGCAQALKPTGIAGIIVSNGFMTTKSGASVRKVLFERFNIRHIWDLGDTKLFDAAVLLAVLLAEGKKGHKQEIPAFTSIYQTSEPAIKTAPDPIAALDEEGVIEISDGRHFYVQHGRLDTSGTHDGVWRIATEAVDTWLATVEAHSWGNFRDIGKIRVGVKTCADKVFIRNDWQDLPDASRSELLKPLTTHHVARRFKPLASDRPSQILYTHEVVKGRRRAVDLAKFLAARPILRRIVRHSKVVNMSSKLAGNGMKSGFHRIRMLGMRQNSCFVILPRNLPSGSTWTVQSSTVTATGSSARILHRQIYYGWRPLLVILPLLNVSMTTTFITNFMQVAAVSSPSMSRNFLCPIHIAPLVKPLSPRPSKYTSAYHLPKPTGFRKN